MTVNLMIEDDILRMEKILDTTHLFNYIVGDVPKKIILIWILCRFVFVFCINFPIDWMTLFIVRSIDL